MRLPLLFLLLILSGSSFLAQSGSDNPFEVKSRLPEVPVTIEEEEVATPALPGNPFEKRHPKVDEDEGSTADNRQGPLVIRRGNEADFLDARGRTLGIHILLLFLTALLWIFFRPFLTRCYSAVLNDGLMSQLYRRRESGQFSIFLICYSLFFMAGGFLIYLVGQAFDWLPSDQPWRLWLYYSGLLFGLVAIKHLVLRLLGWLFSLRAEIGRYSFLIMLFGITLSMFLVPLNLLISYAPSDYTLFFAKAGLFLVALVYLLRSFRAVLIANKFLGQNLLHFLLYICAVEIAPVLVLTHYFTV